MGFLVQTKHLCAEAVTEINKLNVKFIWQTHRIHATNVLGRITSIPLASTAAMHFSTNCSWEAGDMTAQKKEKNSTRKDYLLHSLHSSFQKIMQYSSQAKSIFQIIDQIIQHFLSSLVLTTAENQTVRSEECTREHGRHVLHLSTFWRASLFATLKLVNKNTEGHHVPSVQW